MKSYYSYKQIQYLLFLRSATINYNSILELYTQQSYKLNFYIVITGSPLQTQRLGL